MEIQATVQKNAFLNNHIPHLCGKDIDCVLVPRSSRVRCSIPAVSATHRGATMFINIKMC